MSLVAFACPGCGREQEALPSAEPMHQCPKKNNRVVAFRRQPTEPQETATMAPRTTTNEIRSGNAPRQAKKQAAKVAASKQKLDDLKARQDGDAAAVNEAVASAAKRPRARRPQAEQEPPSEPAPAAAKQPIRFSINGKPVSAVNSSLSGISDVTGRKGGERLSTPALRELLRAAGIANPDSEPFTFTLPNGVVIAAEHGDPPPTLPRAAKAPAEAAAPARKAS